jgi:hypothetical protein
MTVVCSALAATLKAATLAATVLVTGVCPAYLQINKVPPGTVVDFTAATPSRVDLDGISGVTVKGFVSTGTALSALNVVGSNHITLVAPRCIDPGTGCVGVNTSDTVDVGGVWVTGSKGDGTDVAASTNVNVHDGACDGNVSTAIHPDCVQLWSLPGHPLAHIIVQNMTAIGNTQGFDDWDPTAMGATDIQFLDNVADITEANCVGVMNVSSGLVVTGNICRTLPGGTVGPARVSVRTSPGAVISGNIPLP